MVTEKILLRTDQQPDAIRKISDAKDQLSDGTRINSHADPKILLVDKKILLSGKTKNVMQKFPEAQ